MPTIINLAPLIKLVGDVSPDLQIHLLREHGREFIEGGESTFLLKSLEQVGTIEDIVTAFNENLSGKSLRNGFGEPFHQLQTNTIVELGDHLIAQKRYDAAIELFQMLSPHQKVEKTREATNAAFEDQKYCSAFEGAMHLQDPKMIADIMESGFVSLFRERYNRRGDFHDRMITQAQQFGTDFLDQIAEKIFARNPDLGIYVFLKGGSAQKTSEALAKALQEDVHVLAVATTVQQHAESQIPLSPDTKEHLLRSATRLYEVAPGLVEKEYEKASKLDRGYSSHYLDQAIEFRKELRQTLINMFTLAGHKQGIAEIVIGSLSGTEKLRFFPDETVAYALHQAHSLIEIPGYSDRITEIAIDRISSGDFKEGFKIAMMVKVPASSIPLRSVRKGVSHWLEKHGRRNYDFEVQEKYGAIVAGLGFIKQYGELTPDERNILNYYSMRFGTSIAVPKLPR